MPDAEPRHGNSLRENGGPMGRFFEEKKCLRYLCIHIVI